MTDPQPRPNLVRRQGLRDRHDVAAKKQHAQIRGDCLDAHHRHHRYAVTLPDTGGGESAAARRLRLASSPTETASVRPSDRRVMMAVSFAGPDKQHSAMLSLPPTNQRGRSGPWLRSKTRSNGLRKPDAQLLGRPFPERCRVAYRPSVRGGIGVNA